MNEGTQAKDTTHVPSGTTRSKWLFAVVSIFMLLGIPALYLAQKSSTPAPPESGQVTTRSVKPDVSTWEAAEKAAPTVPNKLNLAAAYINNQQPARAVALLDSVLATDPKNVSAWNNYCVVHIQQQDFPAAVDTCTRAMSIDPKFQLAQNNLGWALSEEQKARVVLADDEKVPLASRTSSVDLRDGLHHLHLGEYDASISAFKAMLALDPRSSTAANNIGTAHMMKHEPSIAAEWFHKAIASDPTSEIAKNNLEWANGEIARAKK